MAEGASTPPTNNNNTNNTEFNFELDDDILKNLVNQVERQDPPQQQENKELLELNISVDALHDLVNQTVDILEHEPEQEQQSIAPPGVVAPEKEKTDEIESALLDKLVQDTVGLLEQVGEDHQQQEQTSEIHQDVAVPEDVLSALVSSTVGALEKQKEAAESDELGDAIREALMQHQNPQEEQPKQPQPAQPESEAMIQQPSQSAEQPTHDLEIPQELLKKLASQTFEHIQQENITSKNLAETEDSDALQAALEQMVKNVVEGNVESKAAPVQAATTTTASSGKDDELDLTAMLQNAMQMAMQNPADLLSNMEQALKADTGKVAPKKRKSKEKPKPKDKDKELEKLKKQKEKEEKLAKEKERQKEAERLRIEKEKELAKQKEIEKQKELEKQKAIEREKAAAAAAAAAKAAPPKKVSLSIAETLALTRAKMNNLHRTSTPSDLPAARAPDPRTLIATQRPSTPSSASTSKSRVGKFSNWTNLSYTALKAMTSTLLTTFSKLESASGVTYIDKAVQAENDDMHRMPLGDSPEDIKERNRIRKQKWREKNTEKNKDHDLRARLMKRALHLFPEEEREAERKAWCEKEFETRKQRRIARENEIAHEMNMKASNSNNNSDSGSPAPSTAPRSASGSQPQQHPSPPPRQPPPKPTTISESLALAGVKVDSIPGITDPNLLRNLATVYNTFGNVPGSDSDSAVATTATAVASAYTVANKDEKSLEKQHLTEILKTMLNSLLELMPPAVPTENARIEHIVGSIPGVPRGVISFKVRRDRQAQRLPQQQAVSKSTLPSKQPDMGLTALVKKPNKMADTDASTSDPEKRKAEETIESILKRQRTEAAAMGSSTAATTVGNKIMPWAVSFKPPQYKKPGGAFPANSTDANRSTSPAVSSSSTASVSASPQLPPQQKPILLGATSLRSNSPTPSLGLGGGLRKPGAFRKPQGYATPAGAQKSPSPNRPFSGIQFRKV